MKSFKNAKTNLFMLRLLLFALVFAASGCFTDDTAVCGVKKYDAAVLAEINRFVDDGMQKGSIPGALVAVWNDGYETLLIARGKANVATGRDVKITDAFRAASNTKMFTATAVLMLADQNKLALDDKLSKYLPEIPHASEVSIRQIANHSAGYHNFNEVSAFDQTITATPLKKWTPQELIDLVKDMPLDFTPGEKHSYSNTGYIILGMLIEKVSAMKWENFITEKIFKPLEMNSSFCSIDTNIAYEHMCGYTVEGTTPVETLVDPSGAWAAGSIVSTISDMKKWLDSLQRGTLLSSEMTAEQRKWIPAGSGSYGFGVVLAETHFIGHTGGFAGFNSMMFISLDAKKCIMVVHNVETNAGMTMGRIIRYLNL